MVTWKSIKGEVGFFCATKLHSQPCSRRALESGAEAHPSARRPNQLVPIIFRPLQRTTYHILPSVDLWCDQLARSPTRIQVAWKPGILQPVRQRLMRLFHITLVEPDFCLMVHMLVSAEPQAEYSLPLCSFLFPRTLATPTVDIYVSPNINSQPCGKVRLVVRVAAPWSYSAIRSFW